MPPNNRRRKIKRDAVGRFLIKESGGANEGGSSRRKAVKAASEFHEMPHMFQDAPDISDFMTGDSKTMHLKSVLERNALDEFLACSLSSQTLFDKQNASRILIKQSDRQMKSDGTSHHPTSGSVWERTIPIPRRPVNYVSGRPETVLSAAELSSLESDAFLKWRLQLSKIEEQEGRIMTPFERNLEFWRQLWRVLERSDVIIQILDARTPLFFRSKDLEIYVKEIHSNKEVILLMNKSDLVPQDVRRTWAAWFRHHNVTCLFFSALDELKRQGAVPFDISSNESEIGDESSEGSNEEPCYIRRRVGYRDLESEHESSDDSDSDHDDHDAVVSPPVVEQLPVVQDTKHTDRVANHEAMSDSDNASSERRESVDRNFSQLDGETFELYLWRISSSADVLNASQLLAVLQSVRGILLSRRSDHVDIEDEKEDEREEEEEDENEEGDDDNDSSPKQKSEVPIVERKFVHRNRDLSQFVVGLVGYPNVGKSSVINSVLGHKAVSVSRQPGKTKHFQTLPLPTIGMTLCDCPGLVFPQIVSTKAHLVTFGVSPIDHVRGDFLAPLQIVCDIIPEILIHRYNLNPQFLYSMKTTKPQIIRHQTVPIHDPSSSGLDASKFLSLLATSRGYVSGGKGGLPDLFQTAKFVLRDFTTGKLLYWVLPPDLQTGATNATLAISEPTPKPSAISTGSNASPTTLMDAHKSVPKLTGNIEDIEEALDDKDDFMFGLLNRPTTLAPGQKMTKKKIRLLQRQTMKGKSVCSISINDNHEDSKALRGLASSGVLKT